MIAFGCVHYHVAICEYERVELENVNASFGSQFTKKAMENVSRAHKHIAHGYEAD